MFPRWLGEGGDEDSPGECGGQGRMMAYGCLRPPLTVLLYLLSKNKPHPSHHLHLYGLLEGEGVIQSKAAEGIRAAQPQQSRNPTCSAAELEAWGSHSFNISCFHLLTLCRLFFFVATEVSEMSTGHCTSMAEHFITHLLLPIRSHVCFATILSTREILRISAQLGLVWDLQGSSHHTISLTALCRRQEVMGVQL